jgi:hypothetical protein
MSDGDEMEDDQDEQEDDSIAVNATYAVAKQ